MTQPYRILVVAPSWVGDTVLAQPMLTRLHARHPNARIDVMAPSWTQAVLSRMPEVHAALDNPFHHGQVRLRARWRLGRSLAGQYDQAIVLPNSLKSALVSRFAGIPLRTGYVGEQRTWLLNDCRKLDSLNLPTMAERFAWLAEAPGSPASDLPPPSRPRLNSSPEQQAAVRAAFNLADSLPIVAFCPGAEYGPAKRWPAAHFADLAARYLEQGWQVCLLGSPNDADIGDAITASQPAVHNLIGRTSLLNAIDLIACALHVVSNDSGLMHVAAALNRPLVALYGSSSPDFTPPLSDVSKLVHLNLECSPCFARTCPLGHTRCLQDLQPDYVWEKCQTLNKLITLTHKSAPQAVPIAITL